jgi:hypothetical protein
MCVPGTEAEFGGGIICSLVAGTEPAVDDVAIGIGTRGSGEADSFALLGGISRALDKDVAIREVSAALAAGLGVDGARWVAQAVDGLAGMSVERQQLSDSHALSVETSAWGSGGWELLFYPPGGNPFGGAEAGAEPGASVGPPASIDPGFASRLRELCVEEMIITKDVGFECSLNEAPTAMGSVLLTATALTGDRPDSFALTGGWTRYLAEDIGLPEVRKALKAGLGPDGFRLVDDLVTRLPGGEQHGQDEHPGGDLVVEWSQWPPGSANSEKGWELLFYPPGRNPFGGGETGSLPSSPRV